MKFFTFFCSILLLLSCQNTQNKEEHKVEKKITPPNILFLLADDWSYPHASIYGDKVIKTPTFDHLASEGALFTNAYCAAPSCAPSRAAILTSRYPHQLGSAGNLWSVIRNTYPNWMNLLAGNAYFTGHERKGWGPGDFEKGGYEENPAGEKFDNFNAFWTAKPSGQPFAYWFGSQDPHRPYTKNRGIKEGKKLADVVVPPFLPDNDCVRNDILDYYSEVENFDRECGDILKKLEAEGVLENTIIIMTSDNGMPFPRAKANLYDYGTRMPLAIYWKGVISKGTIFNDFVNFVDFGPTILEATKLPIPKSFHGQSLVPIFTKEPVLQARNQVFLERERHANVRKGDLSYPSRAVRNEEFLYIQNFEPNRWPAGDPTVHQSVGQYGDVDNSISKFIIMSMKGQEEPVNYFDLTFGKRPAEELYDLEKDPYQINNLAAEADYFITKTNLRGSLQSWMANEGDRRSRNPNTIYWDTVQYTPDYQFKNFDLAKEIKAYKITKPLEAGGVEEVPCLF